MLNMILGIITIVAGSAIGTAILGMFNAVFSNDNQAMIDRDAVITKAFVVEIVIMFVLTVVFLFLHR